MMLVAKAPGATVATLLGLLCLSLMSCRDCTAQQSTESVPPPTYISSKSFPCANGTTLVPEPAPGNSASKNATSKYCCPQGASVAIWLVEATVFDLQGAAFDFGNATQGTFVTGVGATCTDSTSLPDVESGNGNGTNCGLVQPLTSTHAQITNPADNIFPIRAAGWVDNFLGVGGGGAGETSPVTNATCPKGTVAVGYSMAPTCYGVALLQVACGTGGAPPAAAPPTRVPAAALPTDSTPPPISGSSSTDSGHSPSGGGGLSAGAIGGIVAGAVVVAVALALVALRIPRKRKQAASPDAPSKRGPGPSSPSTEELAQLAMDPTWPRSDIMAFEIGSDGKGPSTQGSQETADSLPSPWAGISEEPVQYFGSDGPNFPDGSSHRGSARSLITQSATSLDVPPLPANPAVPPRRLLAPTRKASDGSVTSFPSSPLPVSPAGSLQTVTSEEWHIDERAIEYLKDPVTGKDMVLGEGAFGRVVKARAHLGSILPVAVKELSDVKTRAGANIMQEVEFLRKCRHPNIVNFVGACVVDEHKVLLIMEEMAGDLCHALQQASETYQWHWLGKRVALQIAEGLAYLHFRGIIHLDLKSANVLLSRDGTAKLTDVGLSRALGTDRTHLSEQQGYTFAWAAPEVLLGKACKTAADIFSFGVVLYEIAAGEAAPRRGVMRELKVPEDCPQEVVDLINHCRHPEPAQRPSATDVVERLKQLQ